jgi:sortase (surface protein transpeptidase)
MDVGSDFLANRNRDRRRRRRWLAGVFFSLGLLLLAATSGYYLYAANARAGLDGQQVEVPRATTGPSGFNPWAVPSETAEPDGTAEPTPTSGAAETGRVNIPASRFSTLYPGQGVHPKYWDAPYYAEEYRPAGWDLIEGFEPASTADAAPKDTLARASRIQIPAIGVDSATRELRILNIGNSAEWETPNQVVGHIPTTPNAGELGRGYFFGHLESPILGEGNVFSRLPQIPGLLESGEEVFVIVTNADGDQYLYKVFKTEIMHQDDLRLEESSEALISMVACVPRLVYDHRIVVTGELVGIKKASAQTA